MVKFTRKAFSIALLTIHLCYGQSVLRLYPEGGVYKVHAKINGKDTDFIFDSGAADITLTLGWVEQALAEGILKLSDLSTNYKLHSDANGNITANQLINIRELRLGSLTMYNLQASIIESTSGSMLLGQSALKKFGQYTVDYNNLTLTINGNDQSDLNRKIADIKEERFQLIKSDPEYAKGLSIIINHELEKYNERIKVIKGLDLIVDSHTATRTKDGQRITFKYTVTNNSGEEYSKRVGPINIHVEIITVEGQTVEGRAMLPDVGAGNTLTGKAININIGDYTPLQFRIYADTSFPSL